MCIHIFIVCFIAVSAPVSSATDGKPNGVTLSTYKCKDVKSALNILRVLSLATNPHTKLGPK